MKKKLPPFVAFATVPLLAAVPLIARKAAAVPGQSPVLHASAPLSYTDVRAIEPALLLIAPTIRPEALRAALSAWDALSSDGKISRPLLTVIDYGLSSTVRRMWVFDLASRRMLFHELVAHGQNSGGDLAQSFSNKDGSHMTSLGAFLTGATYKGRNGYSLRLRGIEPGVNDRAEARAIVMHGAKYVNGMVAKQQGRLGRSHGCPAIRPKIAQKLIDAIKDNTLLYAWHPSIDPVTASLDSAPGIASRGAMD